MKNIDLIKQESTNIVLDVLPNTNSENLSESSNLFSMGLNSVNAMSLSN